ncbi:hypothetical protein CEXT_664791 [Caerostris extrusa]|uniref:Peptidase A2 domain-containing protein n=1 Tax=Caerostris extrusa TaxID=172846 RepID=A0AAV4YGX7_CAEEX|nr:hypothetical protein CEXT_664791 [Caerostris extrusa]
MLIDSGSEMSFITIELTHELKLPVIRKHRLSIYLLGGTRNSMRGTKREFDVYQMRIRSKPNPCTDLEVKILATDLISGMFIQDPSKCQKIRKFMHERGWMPEDSSPNNEKKNIRLGAEYFRSIQSGTVTKLDENLFVSPTIFGFTFMDKIDQGNARVIVLFLSRKDTKSFDL